MKYCYSFLFSFLLFITAGAQIKYVTQYGNGTMDGSSWGNAWSGQIFADTIYSVTSGTQVWVAGGVYRATRDSNGLVPVGQEWEMQQQATFKIQSGVKLIGGFAGNETLLSQRADALMFGPYALNRTVFDGDSETNPNSGATSNRIVTLKNADNSTLIDGFCFFNGNPTKIYIAASGSQESSPTIQKCCFYLPGEGILIDGQSTITSSPKIINCVFTGLSSQSDVGAIHIKGNAKISIGNSIFAGNQGGVSSCIWFDATPGGSINNCTFMENITFPVSGGGYRADIGISNLTDSVYINNSIIRHNWWQAGAMTNTKVLSGGNYFSVRNCNFQAQDAGPADFTEPAVKINCIDADPEFINIGNHIGDDGSFGTADDGLLFAITSPNKDAGLNDLIPNYLSKDITGSNRVSDCRADIGAYEYQVAAGNIILPENTSQNCTQYPVGNTGTVYTDPASCLTAAKLIPSGANPVTGTVKICVKKDATVQVVSGIPYVQRHYDIEPLQNGSAATAGITLYFTQQEFDNYNLVAGSFPALPASPTDLAGIANIKIEQDHGVSLTSVPGTYNGTTVYIDPVDTDIIWNTTSNVWEVSFNVTGFSGFFITSYPGVLPVTLTDFSATENSGSVKLNWHTLSEINSKYFEVERSADGVHFEVIGKVDAAGNSNGQFYIFNDNNPLTGLNYYKLGMIDINGSKKYSDRVKVNINSKAGSIELQVSPNPATTSTNIMLSGKINGKTSIVIYDINGRNLGNIFTGTLNAGYFSINADLNKFQKGIYVVEIQIGHEKVRRKLIIQ